MNDITLPSDKPLRFREKKYYEITVIQKMKIIDDKIKPNKGQYNSERQIAKIWALSRRNVSK